MRSFKILFSVFFVVTWTAFALSQALPNSVMTPSELMQNFVTDVEDGEKEKHESKAAAEIQKLILNELPQYCFDYCKVTKVDAIAKEIVDPYNPTLGFETVLPNAQAMNRYFRVQNVLVDIVVDSQFGVENTARLQRIFSKLSEKFPYPVSISWSKLIAPFHEFNVKSEAEVKTEFISKISTLTSNLFREFCPRECKTLDIDVILERSAINDISQINSSRYLFARDNKGALFIKGVNFKVAMDSEMDPMRKNRIERLLNEILVPFGIINLSVTDVPFPRPAEEIQKDLDENRADPYGLNKLESLLKILKQHSQGEPNLDDLAKKLKEQNLLETKEKQEPLYKNHYFIAAMILLGLIFLFFLLRGFLNYLSTRSQKNAEHQPERSTSAQLMDKNLQNKILLKSLKDEIMQILIHNPKVGKEVLGRVIREDGIELAAKYTVILGEMVIFGLLNDDDYKKDFLNLAEFIHINTPQIAEDDQIELLKTLKIKMTAGQLKLMNNKGLEIFDFLRNKSAEQIYNLIKDEVTSIQSATLSQLSPDKRKRIIDLYNESAKQNLMKEFYLNDNLTKDYLFHAADVLKKKAENSAEFDSEFASGIDILMDIMQKMPLNKQRDVFTSIEREKPAAAEHIRTRFVSIEVLPFLKESLLVEIFLGLENNYVSAFLNGISGQLRNGILGKIPEDISDNWSYDELVAPSKENENYKLAELQVLNRLQSFIGQGQINLKEINSKLFAKTVKQEGGDADKTIKLNNPIKT